MKIRPVFRRLWTPSLLIIGNYVLFLLTDPAKVSAWVLVAAVLLLTLDVYMTVRFVGWICSLAGLDFARSARARRYTSGLALIIIALGTLGELTFRDVAVLLPLALIMYLFLGYRRRERQLSEGGMTTRAG